VALFFIGAFVVGELIAFCAALVNGEKFGLLSVKYVKYDYLISIISILVLFLWMLIFFRLKERGNSAFPYSFLFGAQIFALILSLVLCVVFLENFFVFIPFALSVTAFILSVFSRSKWVYVISAFFISLLGFSFLYCFITIKLFIVLVFDFKRSLFRYTDTSNVPMY
jgi:hypothetical protein